MARRGTAAIHEVRAQLAQASERVGSPIFALKKTRASGQNVGMVFNLVVKLVLENQPFLMQSSKCVLL